VKSLRGKNVLVTGASGGVGVHIASTLAREGANLVLVVRTAHDLQRVADELGAHGTRVVAIAADINNANEQRVLQDRDGRAAVE
jgi:short-subunit dehydrogenase